MKKRITDLAFKHGFDTGYSGKNEMFTFTPRIGKISDKEGLAKALADEFELSKDDYVIKTAK